MADDGMIYRKQPELTPERIQECREWIARRRAEFDQKKKQFEDEYPLTPPRFNKAKLDLLEAKEFWIDLHEWELDKMIEELGDKEC